MRYTLLYIYALILLVLVSCKEDTSSIIEAEQENEYVLTGINATIIGGDGLSSSTKTRAEEDPNPADKSDRWSYSNDYIGRKEFVDDEKIVLTSFKRTSNTREEYSYTDVLYTAISSAWNRLDNVYKDDENHKYEDKERIYWSDNASPHTCIGFCTPLSWVEETKVEGRTTKVIFNDKKWNKNSGGDYEGAFTLTPENNGTRQVVDFTAANLENISSSNTNKIDRKGTKLQNEDLLLYHKLDQKADIGGMTATLGFRHALASLRVIIDIREFAATQKDKDTKISDLELPGQPYKYKWTQENVRYTLYQGTTNEKTEDIGWGVQRIENDAETATIKTWQPRPDGEGSGEDRTFTFYSLIVPGIQNTLQMNYQVEYANALTNKREKHHYKASLSIPQEKGGIRFIPGYTTTVRVSLNHKGEPIYIGAEFIDWENVETPDQSELQKVSTFLDTSDLTKVTKAGDPKATKEDATWLYLEGTTLKDIYGHVGTKADPFIIKTARQFLSFAYEVNSGNNGKGRTFGNQYVKLEADIFLQKDLKSSDINWPGIGTADKQFNGYFDGGNRIIKLLKGKPLFTNIGANAHIETLQLEDVIGDINGGGCLAEVNNGTLCGCHVYAKNNKEINLTSTSASSGTYSGFICGVNNGTIFACKTQGDFKSAAQYTGGITGKNEGTIVASIAICNISSSNSVPVYGGISAQKGSSANISCCYFDKDKMKDVTAIDLTDCGKTTTEMQKKDVVDALNAEIQKSSDTHFKTRNYTFHVGQYPRVH